ncbi:MAG: hypothetical protein ACXWZL_04020 [Mycobacterium sp.]
MSATSTLKLVVAAVDDTNGGIRTLTLTDPDGVLDVLTVYEA